MQMTYLVFRKRQEASYREMIMAEHTKKPFCESSRRLMLSTTAIRELSFIRTISIKKKKGRKEVRE